MFQPSALRDLVEAPPASVELKPYTLAHLIAWLEMKPAGERYPVLSHQNCILGQYATHVGREVGSCTPYEEAVYRFDKMGRDESVAARYIAHAFTGDVEAGYTFGAALERARKQQAAS